MPYDGSAWDETTPTNGTSANEIDDVARDMKTGVRSRMANEHVWPATQTATSDAGFHTVVSFQAQTGTPTMPLVASVTQAGMFFVTSGNLVWQNSAGATYTVVASGNILNFTGGRYSATGTQGDLIIGTSGGTIKVLAASAEGLALVSRSNTADPNWQAVFRLGTANTAAGITTFAATVSLAGNVLTGARLAVAAATTKGLSNNESFTVPTGSYVIGVKRGGDGSIDELIYATN